ncbi:hypothetical protein CKO28_24100 [Rhodovibrio sodomensis]|uniref:Uncharacterized protein n=1 Tax=Rhodovibrio sodomensis TaxID=1088 RepID=A0ABS1DKR9_9PROT|nr:hypothetical protein [Rhodovibrio sodomensis]MBK1671094.1 hypothetical protein [Rhodovibrio sodomensis]
MKVYPETREFRTDVAVRSMEVYVDVETARALAASAQETAHELLRAGEMPTTAHAAYGVVFKGRSWRFLAEAAGDRAPDVEALDPQSLGRLGLEYAHASAMYA